MSRLPLSRIACLLLMMSLLTIAGCTIAGFAAAAMPPPTILPRYYLTGQSVGVMVWAEKGVRIDWPTVQLDLAAAVEKKLQSNPKAKEMKGTTFPVKPASIVRFQQDHPELDGSPVASIAPKLGVDRLIYIELEQFATRSDLAVDLFRGTAEASVKVLEVKEGQAHEAYGENAIKTAFPPKAPPEGIPNAGDYKIYTGTIDALATEIANRFMPHMEEEF